MPSARTADFPAAQRRHWSDAEFLLDAGRLANADQLYGYCAKCGLKAAMITLGLRVDKEGHPKGEGRTPAGPVECVRGLPRQPPRLRAAPSRPAGAESVRGLDSQCPLFAR